MNMSVKYKEIFRLKTMLEKAKIPFDFFEMDPEARKIIPEWEHWHINYPSRDNCIVSVIEGIGSYGEQDDKLEIMGGLTKEESEHDAVVGWLTAENVFERIKKLEKGVIKMKKVIRYVDEDTLEIIEKVIDDGEEYIDADVDNTVALFKQALGCDPDDFSKRYTAMKQAEKEFEEVYVPFKENLIKLHSQNTGLPKSVVIGTTKLTYVSPSTRSTIDSKKLKEEEPRIAEKYTKTTNVKATIRLEETV